MDSGASNGSTYRATPRQEWDQCSCLVQAEMLAIVTSQVKLGQVHWLSGLSRGSMEDTSKLPRCFLFSVSRLKKAMEAGVCSEEDLAGSAGRKERNPTRYLPSMNMPEQRYLNGRTTSSDLSSHRGRQHTK